jgi:hypothetical protein
MTKSRAEGYLQCGQSPAIPDMASGERGGGTRWATERTDDRAKPSCEASVSVKNGWIGYDSGFQTSARNGTTFADPAALRDRDGRAGISVPVLQIPWMLLTPCPTPAARRQLGDKWRAW